MLAPETNEQQTRAARRSVVTGPAWVLAISAVVFAAAVVAGQDVRLLLACALLTVVAITGVKQITPALIATAATALIVGVAAMLGAPMAGTRASAADRAGQASLPPRLLAPSQPAPPAPTHAASELDTLPQASPLQQGLQPVHSPARTEAGAAASETSDADTLTVGDRAFSAIAFAMPMSLLALMLIRQNRQSMRLTDAAIVQERSRQQVAFADERRSATAALAAGEQLSRAIISSLPAQIAVVDRRGVIRAVNSAWDRFTSENGPASAERCGIGSGYLDVCRTARGQDSEEAPLVLAGIERVLAGDAPYFELEYPCHSPTQKRWFLLTVTPLQTNEGGAVVAHFDISRRKLAEQEVTQSLADIDLQRKRFEDLLANVPGIVWEASGEPGPAQQFQFVSQYAQTMLGHEPVRWLVTPGFWAKVIAEADIDRALREMRTLYREGRSGPVEYRCVTHSGRQIWVETNCSIVRDASGAVTGMRGVTMDITSRKRAQRALRKRAAELIALARALKRSNAELDQFAYVTSHDLRAPLRGIANLSRWIEEDMAERFTPEAHEQMNLLRGRVHRMEALIDGILEYSRVGRVSVRHERTSVGQLLEEVIDLLDPPPGFRVIVEPGMPTIHTERMRLQQVLMNLINNAIKHHHRGQGTIHVRCRPVDDRTYEFSVADDGPGIAPQYHEKVFQIFQTLVARDRVEGTGLGLSLVKKIVENQGGVIRLDSDEGRGATVSFTWKDQMSQARVSAHE